MPWGDAEHPVWDEWGWGYNQTVRAWRPLPCPTHPQLIPPVPEGVACGSEALTLLENTETRSQFIDELMEVGTTRQPVQGQL